MRDWGEDQRTEDDEFTLADLIGIAILLAVIDIKETIMATVEELQAAIGVLQTSVSALVAAEAAEGAALQPGQVAVDQSTLDSLTANVQAAQSQVDAVTAEDTAPPPAPEPPVEPAPEPPA